MADLNMSEQEQKAAFAAFFLESETALQAALKLYPDQKDMGEACRISFAWVNDPYVLQKMDEIKENGDYEDPEIPSKKMLIRNLKDIIADPYCPHKERINAIKLIADLQAYITKAENADGGRKMPSAPVYAIVGE